MIGGEFFASEEGVPGNRGVLFICLEKGCYKTRCMVTANRFTRLGSQSYSQLGSQLVRQLRDQLDNQLGRQLHWRLYSQLRNQLESAVHGDS